jgi:cell division inhibitor SepF
MGAMHKMGVYLGLVEEADRYEDERDEPREERSYARDSVGREGRTQEPVSRSVAVAERRMAPPIPRDRAEVPPPPVIDPYRITTLHPRTYNEARQIGEQFREGVPVIMNLTEMDDVDAKRLVDFSAGLVFGCHGTIERVTQKVFLLSPANVDVTAEDKARIARGGFFNQS